MPYPIERKLVVAVSSRAVFDLEGGSAPHRVALQGVHALDTLWRPTAQGPRGMAGCLWAYCAARTGSPTRICPPTRTRAVMPPWPRIAA